MLRVLRFGYRIPWREAPPQHRRRAYPQPPADLKFGNKTADSWVSQGFVRELDPAAAAQVKHASPTFVVHHPKERLVIDLSAKNDYMEDRPFAYDNLTRFSSQLLPGDHLVSWDISDAFLHVPLSPADQRRLCFRVGDRFFFPLTLPFGIKLSPFVFTKVLRPVVGALRRASLIVMAYMDDFGARPPGSRPATEAQATAARRWVLALFSRLGITVHPTKGAVVGTTALPLLGYILDTQRQLILLPPARLASLTTAARALSSTACASSRRVSIKDLQRFIGKAVSCSLAVPAGRLFLQRLYAAQRGHLHARTVKLTHGPLRDLTWWRNLSSSPHVGRALWPSRLGILTTDASPYGWNAHWNGTVPASGFFSASHLPSHINVKEVEAVTHSLLAFHHHYGLRDGLIDLSIDSRVAMSCINSFASRSPALNAALRRLYAVCRTLGLTLKASWLASLANIWADRLSRDPDRTDWRLCPRLFARLVARYGPHELDLFATSLNALCPRFFSFPASPGCDGIDAFRQNWSAGNLYANPPFSKIPLVLAKIASDAATVTLILPVWQDQDWWPEAIARAKESFLLPRSAGLFEPGRAQRALPHPHWRAAVFRFLRGGKQPLTSGALTSAPSSSTPLAMAGLPPLPSPTCATSP